MDPPNNEKQRSAPTSTPRALKLSPHSTTSPNGSGFPSPRPEVRSFSGTSSPSVSQRSSFIESARGIPHSPHIGRNTSITQQALQELIDNPPVGRLDPEDAKLAGRDWRTIKVGEIIAPEETRFVQTTSSVEEATKILTTSGAPNVVLIREKPDTREAVGAFDYDDLIAYLLLVTELALPSNANDEEIADIIRRTVEREPIPLEDVKYLLGRKEPPAFLDHTATLTKAVEIFGSGFHRIIVRKQGTNEVVGVLSQLRLVRFFWENMKSFGVVHSLNAKNLKELEVGKTRVVSIRGDQPLKDALLLMHTQGITSLPVLDNHKNVIGNISHVDANLLTTTAALSLLKSSCSHFITVILSERGMIDGKDSYPVFHVTPYSTLAHTVAKLVATRSHRMWIVEPPSPRGSVPASPSLKPTQNTSTSPPLALSPPGLSNHASVLTHNSTVTGHTSLASSTNSHHSHPISSGFSPYPVLSGHITGVISLTDVLNLYARASGLSPLDPEETRRRRRTSSSSSVRSGSVRASVDGSISSLANITTSARRATASGVGGSVDLSRSVGDIAGGGNSSAGGAPSPGLVVRPAKK